MVTRQDKLAVAERIREALEEFVNGDERENVQVFESTAGNLRAVIGTRKFEGCGPVKRQEMVWEFLNRRLDADDLLHLIGVSTKDADEYASDVFRHRSAAAVDLFIPGTLNSNRSRVNDE